MKYAVGDKIKIREWEDLESQYGLQDGVKIQPPEPKKGQKSIFFTGSMEMYFTTVPHRIVTITGINEVHGFYNVEETGFLYSDYMILCRVGKDHSDNIKSRFDILDL